MDAALIAIVGAVVGILLSNGIKLVLDARGRAERVRDIQTALRAEMRSHRQTLEVFLDEQRGANVIAQIMNEPGFSPFVPHEVSPFIFDAVAGDIHMLPGSVIDPPGALLPPVAGARRHYRGHAPAKLRAAGAAAEGRDLR